jgi:FkbM family methyltransferase
VEANPINLERLETNPHSIIIHSAICDKRQTVHFYHQNHQSGIVEFSQLSDDKRAAMLKLSVEVECLPLAHVFQAIKVSHVNYFVLDVEGAELNILQSIDWDLTKFDVIVVETDRNSRRPGFAEDVAAFMLTKGYLRVDNISGRNSWYRRVDFVPSRRPTIAEGCYSGSLWATRWRFRNATQQDNFKKCPAGFFSDSNKHCQNCGMIQPPS